MWKKDLEQAAVDVGEDEEGLLAAPASSAEEDLPSSGAGRTYHDEDEERAVGRGRAFRLDDSSDEGEEEEEEGSQGAWQESRGAAGGGAGDMSKASRLLGVTVGKDVVGRR